MKVEEIIGEITRLVVYNEDFSKLYSSMNAFNPLKILDIEEQEFEQLNTFAWLLHPRNNHHLGDYFLKHFITQVIVKNEENELAFSLSPLKLQLSNFYDAKLFQDWRTPRKKKPIDLLITSESNKLVLLILHKNISENIHYHLQECLSMIEEHKEFERYNILPIYLTETGEEPPNKRYCHFTFEDLYALLNKTISYHSGQLNEKVASFLMDYRNFLRDTSHQSEEQVRLCRSIYRDHQEIIHWLMNESKDTPNKELKELSKEVFEQYAYLFPFIIEHGKEDPFITAMDLFLEDKLSISLSARRLKNSEQWFYPLEFMNIEGLQKAAHPNWHSPYPISYYFKKENEKLKLKLEIGPFSDPTQRMNFIKYVDEHSDYKISAKAYKIESVSTILQTEAIPFEEWEWGKEDIIATRMNHLFKYKFTNTHKQIIQLINEFDWSNW